jgi:cytoskeletal protein CcmA (bactofilin family)
MRTDADPQSRTMDSSPPGTSTIGEDLVITGDVTSKSTLHIDGHVHGDVRCASLVLGENSEIEGNVVAEDVVIRGRLIGSVRGVRVILQSTGHVEGDLLHSSLAVEQGAYFEGSRRAEDPFRPDRPVSDKPTAAEPQSAGPADSSRDKSSKGFIRSLSESNRADDHINYQP